MRVTVVPHTHWDREWYLPVAALRGRLVRMMDASLDALDGGLPHVHLDGQTAMIEDYLEERPGRLRRISRLAVEGRISVGPWFTQLDEFLCSGESHLRNLEWGLAMARRLGSPLVPVGYLPDQFGHIGQMPQILRHAGVEHAVVWRGVPAAVDRTAFRWRSPDGSEVVSEYLVFGYSLGVPLRANQDPAHATAVIRRTVEALEPFTSDGRYLVMAGGDYAGADPSLPGRLADQPDVAVGSLADHVAGRDAAAAPVWVGEMRSSARAYLLPGVVSSRIHQKADRARAEHLIERYAEPLAALVPGFEWPAQELDRAWRLLLWNGAHDSVCGCCADEVAEAVDERHRETMTIARDVMGRALGALAAQVADEGLLVFNPSPFEREDVPGLGWAITRPGSAPTPEAVRLRGRPGGVEADGIELTLLDEPDEGDLYTFCPRDGVDPQGPREQEMTGGTALARFESGTLVMRARRDSPDDPFVRFDGVVLNEAPGHRLRVLVRLPHPTETVVAGSPFELVVRPALTEGSPFEPPVGTWPARGVVMAAGLAVLADGVVEYELVDGTALAVTLLRAVGTISRPGLATRAGRAGPDVPTPAAQLLGPTPFGFAVMSNASRETVLSAWERYALPLVRWPAPGGGQLPGRGELLRIRGAELSSVRRREGAVEVRVWNPAAGPTRAEAGGRAVELRGAGIETVTLAGPAAPPPSGASR